jgi:hypothetical protein
MWPTKWRDFVTQNNLSGKEIEIAAADDLSQVGGCIAIFDEQESQAEADEFYPGIGVKAHGFVPVGGCAIGTGDPYFINSNDPQPGPLYRIYHDCVSDENYNRDQAVAKVLNSYEELLGFVDI